MGDDNGRGIWIPMLAIVCIVIGYFVGSVGTRMGFQKEAVERGFAEYDSQSGYWQWVDVMPEQPPKDQL